MQEDGAVTDVPRRVAQPADATPARMAFATKDDDDGVPVSVGVRDGVITVTLEVGASAAAVKARLDMLFGADDIVIPASDGTAAQNAAKTAARP